MACFCHRSHFAAVGSPSAVEVAVRHITPGDAVFLAALVGFVVAVAGWFYFILSTWTTLHVGWSQVQFGVVSCVAPPAMGLVAAWVTLYITNQRSKRTVRKIDRWEP